MANASKTLLIVDNGYEKRYYHTPGQAAKVGLFYLDGRAEHGVLIYRLDEAASEQASREAVEAKVSGPHDGTTRVPYLKTAFLAIVDRVWKS